MKRCTKCDQNKELNLFYRDSKYKDGYINWCKPCFKEYKSKSYKDNKESYKERSMAYYNQKKEEYSTKRKEYYKNNKLQIKENTKKYYQQNKENINKRNKAYKYTNKSEEKERNKKWSISNKDKILARHHQRYKHDTAYKLRNLLRNRLRAALKGEYKSGSAVEDLGCTIKFLKNYLESKFAEGMSWENHSLHGWHIDHIKPLSSYNLSDKIELKEACHYTNLQPLWAKDNLWKSNKTMKN